LTRLYQPATMIFMWPVLFRINACEIRSCWVMVSLGVILTITLAVRDVSALRKKLPSQRLHRVPTSRQMAVAACLAFLSGLIGARITYLLYNIQHFTSLNRALDLSIGGFASFGGYLGAIIAVAVYSRITNTGALEIADLGFAYIPVFDIFQRLGCLLNGCCFGKATSSWLGMILPDNKYSAARHPVPLYFIALSIIIFTALRILRGKPHQPGAITLGFFTIYFPFRFVIEFFRPGKYLVPGAFITVAQMACLELFIVCVFFWRLIQKKSGENNK